VAAACAWRPRGGGYHAAVLAGVVIVAAVAGAAWGVWLPALVNRYAVAWPDGAARPPWRRGCAHCGTERSRWWQASERCPACGWPPTPRWRVTVPLSAVTWAVIAAAIGWSPALPAFLLLAAVAVPLALIDLKVLRLPDPLVGFAFAGGVLLLSAAALITGDAGAILRAFAAAAVCGVVYALPALLPRTGLGFGDVKLAAVLGLYLGWLGWFAVVAGLVLTPLVNLPLVIGLLVSGRAGRRTAMPYGPAMLVAGVLSVVGAALR
jgi:leader peptidase (prepilin peptidase)/N-methyltransferase